MAHGDQGPRQRGLVTRKKHKAHSNGSRAKTIHGTGWITECSVCPSSFHPVRKQVEPQRVACSGVRGQSVSCKEGHSWRVK
jgi:hypothetical protein